MRQNPLLRILSVLWLVHDFAVAQSPSAPRWGQAASLVQNTLYIHGGRTDQYNSYAYSSAPVTNDLLTLDLSSSFDVSSPPWNYTGGCANCTGPQGPAVAWHTLSAFNASSLLLFGGDPGPNSPIALPEQADSAVLLDIGDQNTAWDFTPESWANEPLRRIYHSASSSQGKIWIIGGLKADGSGNAFSEHYVFDPTVPSFTQLPSTNSPPDILGHTSVVLTNGWLLVFGGYSPSQQSLIPLTTVWAFDTTQLNSSWSTLPIASAVIPPSRRGFAATLLDKGKVLIHGGADAVLQTSLSDGWILDTTQNPMVWTSVDALSQLGPRRDHTAVTMGASVLFAFGFADNGPAPPALFIFDTSSSSFQSSFTPPPSGSTITTLPGSSPTSSPGSPSGSSGNGESSDPGSSSPTGSNPTSSSPGNDNGSGGGGGGGNNSSSSDNDSHTTTIALGTVFGVIGLMLGTTAAALYVRRRSRSQESFHLLSPSSDEEDSPHLGPMIPIAGGAVREKGLPLPPVVRNVKDRLTGLVPGHTLRAQAGRRDMLAEEDTRHFEADWWAGGIRRDPSSGRSSFKRPTLGDKVYGSLASLRSVGGAMLDYAAGSTVVRTMRKEGSGGSRSMWTRSERDASDPFADDWGLVQEKRPGGGRHDSSYSYVDPFDDYEVQSVNLDYDEPPYVDAPDEEKGYLTLNDPPPRPYLQLPPATDLSRLTPVSKKPSLTTLTESGNTPSDSSHSNPPLSPFSTSAARSTSSHDTLRSSSQWPSSLIDANSPSTPPSVPIRRSNSWWTRFAKTPLLDRRNSDASRNSQPLDFRDPNPPPSRLVPIREATSPTNSKRGSSGGHHQLYSSHAHERSASSLQTSRTANSEMIERMGRTMDIVQKGSHGTGQSSSGGESGNLSGSIAERPLSVITSGSDLSELFTDPAALVMSPDSMVDPKAPETPTVLSPRKRSPTSNVVSARVQAYERRMSTTPTREDPPLKSPPLARSRGRGSTYGVVPKPSLFVANPDRERSGSAGS